MFWKENKSRHRDLYYLLPGMGKGARRRFRRNITVGILVGLLVSGGLAAVFYYFNIH